MKELFRTSEERGKIGALFLVLKSRLEEPIPNKYVEALNVSSITTINSILENMVDIKKYDDIDKYLDSELYCEIRDMLKILLEEQRKLTHKFNEIMVMQERVNMSTDSIINKLAILNKIK